MPTLTEVLPPAASSPHAAIRWTPGVAPGTGTLRIDDARSSTTYRVADIPTGWQGVAAQLVKVTAGTDAEADGYAVFVGKPHDSCECRGFLRHGRCKHVEAVRALVANNWLSRAELANPEADVSNTEVDDQPAPRPGWVPASNADLQGGF